MFGKRHPYNRPGLNNQHIFTNLGLATCQTLAKPNLIKLCQHQPSKVVKLNLNLLGLLYTHHLVGDALETTCHGSALVWR